jgi:hypothetical protein
LCKSADQHLPHSLARSQSSWKHKLFCGRSGLLRKPQRISFFTGTLPPPGLHALLVNSADRVLALLSL